jgi:tetratricopeptide (TPR) repeat protein
VVSIRGVAGYNGTSVIENATIRTACRLLTTLFLPGMLSCGGSASPGDTPPAGGFTGSLECRSCHERFYELWEPSRHGRAMQPFTPSLAGLRPPAGPVVAGGSSYEIRFEGDQGWVVEEGDRRYPMEHALGGKNVYYFLTPLERGRLQVLPVAYDVAQAEWFDTTASMVRHFGDRDDEAVEWRDRALTFNTSCHGCHVSQISTNYDLDTDSYRTVWVEPGINCETCHGPGAEHVAVCRAAPEGTVPEDLRIISTSSFTIEQNDETCAPCHAKMYPITADFMPGDRYFDHFGLLALEHPDFHPDGRDLGENYTFTQWRMNPCARSGQLGCLHCHTSSGRNRHVGDEADNACMPCHEEYVADPAAHSFHKADQEGARCVGCHMPRTTFARMVRHDHSFLAPTPATTLAFGSPNACNICHDEHDAAWSDDWVRRWYPTGYQEPVLHRARLIDDARRGRWDRLAEMLAYINDADRDEIFATSLIRLLETCPHEEKWPVLRAALKDPSPLVRSAAAAVLGAEVSADNRRALLTAAADEFRLVRVAAGGSLARFPLEGLTPNEIRRAEAALGEYEGSLRSRPDDWASHYNLGNHHLSRGGYPAAVEHFRTAQSLRPDFIPPLVNESLALARMGRFLEAEQSLRRALEREPTHSAAHFNLGLLLAEKGGVSDAERHLRAALESEPEFAEAAHNLGVLLGEAGSREALHWCREAVRMRPDDQRYAYTLAFYLDKFGEPDESVPVLRKLVSEGTSLASAYALLGRILEDRGSLRDAREVYRRGAESAHLSPAERRWFAARLPAEPR